MSFAFPSEQASSSREAPPQSSWLLPPGPWNRGQHPPIRAHNQSGRVERIEPSRFTDTDFGTQWDGVTCPKVGVSSQVPLASLVIHGDLLKGGQWPSSRQNAQGRGCTGILQLCLSMFLSLLTLTHSGAFPTFPEAWWAGWFIQRSHLAWQTTPYLYYPRGEGSGSKVSVLRNPCDRADVQSQREEMTGPEFLCVPGLWESRFSSS